MGRQINTEQLQQQIASLTNRLEESKKECAELKRDLLASELLKNRYYNGHVRIIAESSVWLPSRAMRTISEETLYGEEKGI